MTKATPTQRISLTLGAFVASQAVMAASHEGMIGTILAAGIGLAGWSFADEVFSKLNEGDDNVSLPTTSSGKKHGLAYRLVTSRDRRVSDLPTDEDVEQELQRIQRDGNTDLALPPSALTGARFDLSEVLATGFRPTLDKIYIGTLGDGTHVFCPAEALCHVALAGATDAGKSSIMRMLLAQLCYVKAVALLLNPHYTGYIVAKKEDWTPFTPYLAYDPMKCKEYPIIEHFLKQTAEVLIPQRLNLYAQSKPVGRPHFIVIDELPAIVKKNPNTPDYLDTILKEGRKVGVYLISAAQDYLVQTIGGSGAVRDCYRTAYYVGGDDRTAKVLLDMVPSQDGLGKGVVYLRNATAPSVKKAQLAYVPFTDNEALYTLLGPSTYTPDDDVDTSGVDLVQGNQGNVDLTEKRTEGLSETATIEPVLPDRGRMADDIDINVAITVYNSGITSKYQLAKTFGLSESQGRKLKEKIEAIAKAKQQENAQQENG
jgi:hypothetical protein